MSIANNLELVKQKVEQAADAAGRNAQDIKLLAVSKTKPVSVIMEAYQAGQRFFAENRVQEWKEKAPELPAECEWHLIGSLQTNKVKYLTQDIKLIHSLDRYPLLKELEEYGRKREHIWPALVQVNIARDPAKSGLLREELEDFLTSISDHPHVQVYGLMTIGALEASADETRGFFKELRMLLNDLQKKSWPGVKLEELSMGMSQDFELAIEEGATIIRVGREIFGSRSQ